jgi:hypothetical protein
LMIPICYAGMGNYVRWLRLGYAGIRPLLFAAASPLA